MIDCNDIRPRLTALLDSELPDEEANLIRQHLEGCTECAGIMADYMDLRAAVKAAPLSETVDLWDAISLQIGDGDDSSAVLNELRRMREEMTLLREEVSYVRGEVADLRRELTKRPSESITPRTPVRFPGLAQPAERPYRLV